MPGLERVVRDALNGMEILAQDRATAELALTYARYIDAGDDLSKLGPALLSCLAALGMTPAARKAALKGGNGGTAATPLDELRARRAKRSG
jgi:hypothetical protein